MSDILAVLAMRRRPTHPPLVSEHTQRMAALELGELLRAYAGTHDFIEVMHDEVCVSEFKGEPTKAELDDPGVSSRSAQEVWTCGDGRRIRIGDMDHRHLVHALALVMRKLRQEGGHWELNESGALRHFKLNHLL